MNLEMYRSQIDKYFQTLCWPCTNPRCQDTWVNKFELWCLILAGPQYRICCMAPFWNQQFPGGSYISWKFVDSHSMCSYSITTFLIYRLCHFQEYKDIWRQKSALTNQVSFVTHSYCVQCIHTNSYASEPDDHHYITHSCFVSNKFTSIITV